MSSAGVGVLAAVCLSAANLIPDAYLADKYVAPPGAPSSVVIAGKDEPGERLMVSGTVKDTGGHVLAGVSVFAFHTDASGRYAEGPRPTDDENARLHGAMRTDANGRYQFESIRPAPYGQANPAHIHYVVRLEGYKPRMFELWFEGDPAFEQRRQLGIAVIPSYRPPGAVEIRPITKDAQGVWHATRDFILELE